MAPSRDAALAAALLAVACAAPQADVPASELTFAIRADVTGFFPNPPIHNEADTFEMARNVYQTLVGVDPYLRIQPELAESWTTPDDRTYVFVLDRDARFSDGRPVRAADVVASFEAAREQGWPNADYVQLVESARVLDPHRVEIRTRSANLTLLSRLPWGFVLPADARQGRPVEVVGSGPYRLESWKPREELILTRNPVYGGAPPAFERVRFVVVPEGRRRVAMVESGEADVADHVPLDELDRLETVEGLVVLTRSDYRVLFLCLRVDRPPFDDLRVREAVSAAIDVDALIGNALYGRAQPATQLVPPSILGHDPSLGRVPYDPERARELLAEAGLAEGFSVRLDGTRNRYVGDTRILAEVARQLAEVGIRVEVDALDKNVFFERIDRGDSSFHLLGWSSISGDAGDALEFLMHSRKADGLGRLNTAAISDPELDALIEASARATDVQQRGERMRAAMRRIAELHPIVPLVVETSAVVHSDSLLWEPGLHLSLRPGDMRPRQP